MREIGAIKKRDGLPVTNSGREEVVVEKARSHALTAGEKAAMETVYRAVIAASKTLEE